ncbi:hypothetical protein [Sulfurimonas sp. HSL3-7]|uniref:hypothetical protein n=1 Tax=Sulfonitrofixus jiaomeiensis TaxID=3131938 RepID=UPI0031F84DC7
MRFLFVLFALLLSVQLYAQKTLQEIRVEENIFILKIVVFVVLFLIAMPFILRILRVKASLQGENGSFPVQHKPKKAKVSSKVDSVQKEASTGDDPLDQALETLFNEHHVSPEERERCMPLYQGYIELKSGKLEVKTGSFDFNTVLEAVTAKLHALEEERNFEVVFDINANVPAQLIGDADRITDMLFFVLQSVVLKSSSYVIEMRIKRLNLGDESVHLEFHIPYARHNYQEENLDIFTPFINETPPFGLELYLAREYARLMQGDITFELYNHNDSMFVINLKLHMLNPSEMRYHRLPSKTMIEHSILIVDDHKESALAEKNMFAYFKNEVDVLSSKELFGALEMLDDYDLVVIQERYYSHNLVKKLQEIKSSREIKVVSLNKNQEFRHTIEETLDILDAEIHKPVTIQKVYDLLVLLYQEKSEF